jgi:putative sterol carrier protein
LTFAKFAMATVQDISERLRRSLIGQAGLTKTLKLDFKGEGFIFVDGAQVTNEDKAADCTVVISREDLEALAKGRLDPMSAMMRGRLKVLGDMSVAMKLQSMLRTEG